MPPSGRAIFEHVKSIEFIGNKYTNSVTYIHSQIPLFVFFIPWLKWLTIIGSKISSKNDIETYIINANKLGTYALPGSGKTRWQSGQNTYLQRFISGKQLFALKL